MDHFEIGEGEKSGIECNVKIEVYKNLLVLFFTLFAFRVVAQIIQKFFPVSFLPPFEQWQSGALPYGWLVFFQIVILFLCLRGMQGVWNETSEPVMRKGKWFLLIGALYFLSMLIRLIIGLTLLTDHPWFGALIPAMFHLVLASFIMVLGHYHFRFQRGA